MLHAMVFYAEGKYHVYGHDLVYLSIFLDQITSVGCITVGGGGGVKCML